MKAAAALVAVCAMLAAAVPARAAGTISLGGEVLVGSLVADLAYFYRHEVRNPPRFVITGGDTDSGIADTVRGISDGTLASRAVLPSDPPGLYLTQLALSGVCLVTNVANPVPNLTHDELQDIVAARVTSWSQVPGSTRSDAIQPVVLGVTSGAANVFATVFVDFDTPMAWQPVTIQTNSAERQFIEQTPAALGYVDLAFTPSLHPIPYQGVACTRQTISNGTYPARRPLGIITRGKPRGALARFLHWATTSRVARRVIATRYIPG